MVKDPLMDSEKLIQAFQLFDDYNSKDPEIVTIDGKALTKSLLYGFRMTDRLKLYAPAASVPLQLAARCQHVGRWEIARAKYSMDKKGYFQWRNAEKEHQCKIAENTLKNCDFDDTIVGKVKFLLMKKEIQSNEETRVLEDVICLVFIEFYLDEFASKHLDDKVVDILKKTMKKMTSKALSEVSKLQMGERVLTLIQKAKD